MGGRRLAVLAALGLGLLSGCRALGGEGAGPAGGQYPSNGQRIYFSATDSSGQAMSYQGGPMGGMGQMGGIRLACASCHGQDGHGGRVTMGMQTFDVPNVTWPVLTGQVQSGEMDHPPYTLETVKRAIAEGIDPAGKPLEPQMPRWSVPPQDLSDLVGYLQTLK